MSGQVCKDKIKAAEAQNEKNIITLYILSISRLILIFGLFRVSKTIWIALNVETILEKGRES